MRLTEVEYRANVPVPVRRGPSMVLIGDKSFDADCEVELRWIPTPAVVITAELPKAGFGIGDLQNPKIRAVLSFPGERRSIELATIGWSMPSPAQIRAHPGSEFRYDEPSPSFTSLEFALVNFEDFHVPRFDEGRGVTIAHSSIALRGGEWEITLRSHSSTQDVVRGLREEGGFGVTHLAEARKSDDSQITPGEAHELLWALQNYLAFARGSWCPLALVSGRDAAGGMQWETWGLGNTERWQVTQSWFDPVVGGLLGEAFPGFLRRWQTPSWQRSIQAAIYWYVHSNSMAGGLDGSVILSQAALELLSWLYLVEDRKALSRDGFARLPAADQIRLLLSSLSIPSTIPAAVTTLNAEALANNWEDGPAAATAVRNAAVHPNLERRSRFSPELLWDVWNLQQWYIELALLRLFEHNGNYANRLQLPHAPGAVAPVPWAE